MSANKLLACLLLICMSFSTFASAGEADILLDDPRYYAAKVSKQLNTTESEFDYTQLMLSFNAMVDSRFDIEATNKTLNDMAAKVQLMAGDKASDQQLLSSLRQFIYDKGEWNNDTPFTYDHDDPLGTYIPNKLIPNYLKSKRGNCVSMPTLFLVLGQKIGLDLTLSTAPNHVFVHYHAPDGKVINIETTSGGHPVRKSWIRDHFHMSDKAIENGMYLKVLTKKQTAAILASIVLESVSEKKKHGYAVQLADVLLDIYPEFDTALLLKGRAFQFMLQVNFPQKKNDYYDVPPEDVGFFNHLAMNADQAFGQAFKLGYVEQPKE